MNQPLMVKASLYVKIVTSVYLFFDYPKKGRKLTE